MSRFTGSPQARWPLAAALDDLFESARRAARPSWIWLAGAFYPTLWSGLELFAGEVDAGWWLLSLLLLPLLARLNAGLARLSPVAVWDRMTEEVGRPGLADCWRAGRGMTLSVLGMHLSLMLLSAGSLLLMLLPAAFAWGVLAEPGSDGFARVALALVALPALAVLAFYNLLLSLLLQLGLHSLVHNRRGVGSALQHAWSVLRHDPWAAGRALTADLILVITLGVPASLLASVGGGGLSALLLVVAALCLRGIAGVTRAAFWARAYRALGGLSPDDGVPGLDPLLFGASAAEAASRPEASRPEASRPEASRPEGEGW